jgi:hypothetical protein
MRAPPISIEDRSRRLANLAIIVSAIGFLCCANATWRALRAEKTNGEIIRVEKSQAKGGWSYSPVFEYRDRTGQRWEGRSPFGSSLFRTYQPGQKVPILYDPYDPADSNLNVPFTAWMLPAFWLIWSMLFALIARRRMISGKKPNCSASTHCPQIAET